MFSNDESKERSYRETVPVLYIYIYRYIELKKMGVFFKSINQVPGDGFALVTR